MIDIEELKRLAGSIATRYEWVTEEWAFQHFGSDMEAKFLVAACPAAVLELIGEIERLRERVGHLEMRGGSLNIMSKQIDALLAHCKDPECRECATIICPHEEPLHFHHDGCPACVQAEQNGRPS